MRHPHIVLPALAIALLVFTGCDTDLKGQWEGECELEWPGGYSVDLDVELDIVDVKQKRVTGDGEFSDGYYDFDGDLEGNVDKKEVDMAIEGSLSGYGFELEMEGTFDKDSIEGDCTMKWLGYSIDGDLDLHR